MARGKPQFLTWALDLRHLCPRSSHQGIAISAALSAITGAVLGISWLVMGVGMWLGGEIRSGRSRRCALVCGAHGFTLGVCRDTC